MGNVINFLEADYKETSEFRYCSVSIAYAESFEMWGPWYGITRKEAIEAKAAAQSYERWYYNTYGPYNSFTAMLGMWHTEPILKYMDFIRAEVSPDWMGRKINLYIEFLQDAWGTMPGSEPWNPGRQKPSWYPVRTLSELSR